MKIIRIAGLLLSGTVFLCGFAQADIILGEGKSFIFPFEPTDFSFESVWDSPAPLYELWEVDIDQIASNGIVTIACYENDQSGGFFETSTYTNTGYSGYFVAGVGYTNNIRWSDSQGLIKIDAINGSIGISGVSVHTIIGNQYLVASIPEPTSITLLLIGISVIGIRISRGSRFRREARRT